MKVLLLDVETAPKRAYVWGLFKQNVGLNQLISKTFMLTWSAKWLQDDQVLGASIHETEEYLQDPEDDSGILGRLWDLLDAADVVVTHNGIRFDIPIINSRFVVNGFKAPSPYRQVDTLRLAKREFRFDSNRLDHLGDVLGVGRKIDTGGFELWSRCMDGDSSAYEEMLAYNKQDVQLLEDVYMRLRPYLRNPPNHAAFSDSDELVCPHCGGKHLQSRGHYMTQVSKFQRFWCVDCESWSRLAENQRSLEARKNTLRPAI